MKSDQWSNDDEKKVNEVVNNVKRWTRGHGFTSGVSQVNKNMHVMGGRITARQLTRS